MNRQRRAHLLVCVQQQQVVEAVRTVTALSPEFIESARKTWRHVQTREMIKQAAAQLAKRKP
jgi:hypothetical protein